MLYYVFVSISLQVCLVGIIEISRVLLLVCAMLKYLAILTVKKFILNWFLVNLDIYDALGTWHILIFTYALDT